jgi:long-subunit acyl-CoA synthetase (AMP-forming)
VAGEFKVGLVLTPTMKIMRDKAKKHYQSQIDEMYAQ